MRNKIQVNLEREITKAENEIVKAKEKLSRLRRRLPKLEVEDYTLAGAGGEKATLSSLFGEKEDLIVIHNMGRSCPYCTMWADGFNGVLKHLENRAAFVVVSPDAPEGQAKDGRIVRVGKARFGPGDDFCSVWHLFGLLRNGSGDWQPRFKY